jgi:hypothetical protein
MVEAAIGKPLAGPVEMTISEEPDGTLAYHFPEADGERVA